MQLTPEYRAIGKENFHAAVGSKSMPDTLRLIKKTVKEELKSGAGLGAAYYGYGEVDQPLKVAVLGTGDEGSVLIGAINPKYIDVVAIADIRPYNKWRAFYGDWSSGTARKVRKGLIQKYFKEAEAMSFDLRDLESDATKAAITAAYDKIEDKYNDYMEVIEAKKAGELDIDAVIIALPLHLHAEAAIAAMKAGLHVLTEKLMGQTVGACKAMARVAEQTKKHLVTGHQRHYNILYANTVKLIEKNVLGNLHFIRAQWHRGNLPGTDSWQQPMPRSAKPDDAQAGVLEKVLADRIEARDDLMADYTNPLHGSHNHPSIRSKILDLNIQIVQTQMQISDEAITDQAVALGYEKNDYTSDVTGETYERPAMEELIRWRLWNRTGGGLMAELGSHQLDASSIFLAAANEGKKQHPLWVDASSARSVFPLDREVDDHVFCLYEYPTKGYDPNHSVNKLKKVTVQYSTINGNGTDSYGETVYGDSGTLVLERELEPYLFKLADTLAKTRVTTKTIRNEAGELVRVPDLITEEKGDPVAASMGQLGTTGLDVSRGYCEEEEHWAYCIQENPEADPSGEQPHCYPKIALGDAVIALTTNISANEGRRIQFKEEWFDIDSDETPDGSEAELADLMKIGD
jgi:predicted dehydrogenase